MGCPDFLVTETMCSKAQAIQKVRDQQKIFYDKLVNDFNTGDAAAQDAYHSRTETEITAEDYLNDN